MRLYTKRYGAYKGQHIIFDSINEAIEELSGDYKELNTNKQDLTLPKASVFPIWFMGNEGDWVNTDDGRIVKLLKVDYLYKYRKDGSRLKFRNGKDYFTCYMKVCFGTYSYFTLKNGGFTIYRAMNADLVLLKDYAVHTGSLSASFEHRPFGKYLTDDKKLFVYWLSKTNFDPVESYKRALKFNHYKNEAYILEKALTLMQDPYVIEELKYYMSKDKTFKERLEEALVSNNLTPERLAEEINGGLEACTVPEKFEKKGDNGLPVVIERPNKKKGGIGHLAWVRTLAQVLNAIEEKNSPLQLPEDTGAQSWSMPQAPEDISQKVSANFEVIKSTPKAPLSQQKNK